MMRSKAHSLRWRWGIGIVFFAISTNTFAAGLESKPTQAETQKPIATDPWITERLPELVSLYTHLHTHPELSRQEVETSKRIADELTKAGAVVTTNVGKLGVVGLLKNGEARSCWFAPTWTRLPVTEETGLPYASKVTTRDKAGREVGVMHACGHDIHMSSFIGTARWLADHRNRGRGPSSWWLNRPRRPSTAPRRCSPTGFIPGSPSPTSPGAPLPARRADRNRRLLLRPDARQLDFDQHHDSRQRGPWRLAAPDGRPDRAGGVRDRRHADDRQPRDRAQRAGGRDGRLDSRRDQAQHHPRRGQAAAHLRSFSEPVRQQLIAG